MQIEGWQFLDSLYMTVITLAAVGFSEVHPLTPAGRIFTIILIILGLGLVTVLFSTIAQKIIHQEVLQSFRGKKMLDQIQKLSGHTIFCGFGKLARYSAEYLHDLNDKIVIIDKSPEQIKLAKGLGFLTIEGDATSEEILVRAGINKATKLVSLLNKDSDNVFVILTSRELSKGLFILTRAEEENSEKYLLRAGANKVMSPYRTSGQKIAEGLRRPYVTDFLNLAVSGKSSTNGRYRTDASYNEESSIIIEEIKIPLNSPINGQTLKESELRQKTNVIVVAIVDSTGHMTFNPSGDTKVVGGETFIVLGIKNELRELEEVLMV